MAADRARHMISAGCMEARRDRYHFGFGREIASPTGYCLSEPTVLPGLSKFCFYGCWYFRFTNGNWAVEEPATLDFSRFSSIGIRYNAP